MSAGEIEHERRTLIDCMKVGLKYRQNKVVSWSAHTLYMRYIDNYGRLILDTFSDRGHVIFVVYDYWTN